MISHYLISAFILTGTLFAWGAYCLPCNTINKIFFFTLNLLGLAYIIPLGPLFDPAQFLPYPLLLTFAIVSAFSFFFFWTKIMHLSIIMILSIISIRYKNILLSVKQLVLSKKLNSFFILFCAILASISVYQAIQIPDVKKVTLFYEDLPDELDKYTIAQISDTHISHLFKKDWNTKTIKKILEQKPQLIVHTGDIGDGNPYTIKDHLIPFKELSAPDGVYFIFGNHENYHNLSLWQKFFQEHNLKVLEDETVHIHQYLCITGAKSQPRYQSHANLLPQKNSQIFNIYLDHYPQSFQNNAPKINLQLSGHTHGGTVFFLAPLIAKFNAGYTAGIYEKDNAKLYINSGTGIWMYTPFRLFVPSEISLITLKKYKKQQ